MPLLVTLVMYEPEVSTFGGITMKRVDVTTKEFNQLPIEGLFIRYNGVFWRCDKVILDANSQAVEAHVVAVDSVVPRLSNA